MKKLIIIAGPTGVGKSEVAVELAKKLNTEIISADSVQVYKGLDIGSGKIMKKEMQGVKHHLLDILEPNEQYSVEEFQKDAKEKIQTLFDSKKIPIICGGTGLYIHSLIYNINFSNQGANPELREKLENILKFKGIDPLNRMLEELDPIKAKNIDKKNHRRIIRAIEIANSGKKIEQSKFREKNNEWTPYYFVLNRDREELYTRINKRVIKMIDRGLVEEVDALSKKYGNNIPGLKTIGYKEIISYFQGDYSFELAIEKIQQHSRNLAKRQLTWYRKEDSRTLIVEQSHSSLDIANIIYKEFYKGDKNE